MSKLTKKVAAVGLSVTTAVWLTGASLLVPIPVTSAQSIADLTAQINALLATISQLQASLAVLQGGGAMSASCSFSRSLTLGATGDDVKCLQQYLNATGNTLAASGVGSPGNETSYFGPLTRGAVAKWQAANSVSQAKYTAVVGATPGVPSVPGVPVPATGLAVSLASDTQLGTSLPKGAANVPFLKFNLAGSGTVQTIVVRRVGAGATTDFDNVYLYDGVTRLTSGRSVNSSSHESTFTNLNLAVSGVKTLTVVADMSSTAAAANRHSFEVVAVTADASVSGIPTRGNEMNVSGSTAGSLTAAKTGSLSNPSIGQVGANVSQFRLSAATEDVEVERIALFYAGTISKSNISNFVLKDVAGNTLATVASINTDDLIIFELSTPLKVLKGDNETLKITADVGNAKKDETIKIYVEEKSDIFGIGQQFGHGVSVTNNFNSTASNHHVLTLQGGTLTIAFGGPNTGDVAKNLKDVVLYDFTMHSNVNLEVRNIRFTVTASTTQAGVDDFKVVDVDSGFVIAGPVDDATGTVVLSDVFTINAGQTRHLNITGDTDTNWLDLETIKVDLNAFTLTSDLKNLDNNQFLTTTEVVPDAVIPGNTLTVKAPTLDVSLAGLPVSDSFVKGSTDVPLIGIGLRATSDQIKVTTIKISASAASGTLAQQKADMLSLKLFDGTTQIGATEALTGSSAPATATFDNLEFIIPKGAQKVLVVKVNLSSSATFNNEYALAIVNVADTTGVDIVAVDTEGNEPAYSGSDFLNVEAGVKITILNAGSVTVATAPDDSESKATIVAAGGNKTIFSKFRFTATNESLTIQDLKLLVNNDSSTAAAATSTAEVSAVYLYDGTNLIGSTSGYVPIGSGSSAGEVTIEDLGWLIPKDTTKTLTVKADLNPTVGTGGGTSGRSIYVHVRETGFEATGAASTVSTLSPGALGKQKVYYETYPEITVQTPGTSALVGGTNDLIKFTVVNKTSNEQLSWGVVSFKVSAAGATLPASSGTLTVTLRDLTNSVNLTIGTTATSAADSATSMNISLYLSSEEQIAGGGSRQYRISMGSITTDTSDNISTQLVLRQDTSSVSIAKGVAFLVAAGSGATAVDGVVDADDSGFVWSDNSAVGHTLLTTDWANGVFVDTFPSDTFSLSN
ncbi:MAG: peptidoglycan-binding protein [Patescibacteria group bacterium]|nr:peptidoglycan-binding protein [Patescibacteria group bacterium]